MSRVMREPTEEGRRPEGGRGSGAPPDPPPLDAGPAEARPAATWTIYEITHRPSGRRYVGLTERRLADRVLQHWRDAGRRGRARAGGLKWVLREERVRGRALTDVVSARALATAADASVARVVESALVDALGTLAPRGLNLMPPGRSIGGKGNALAVDVHDPRSGKQRHFASLGAAIAALCPATSAPSLGLAHWRLGQGWTPEQALGLEPRLDRRGLLPEPAIYDGRKIRALREADPAIPISTLRSRRHRARLAGLPDHDLAVRRDGAAGARHTAALPRLPDPDRPNRCRTLPYRELARRLAVPASTVLHRLHGLLREGADVEAMPDAELIARLAAPPADRRVVLRVRLPNGRTLLGGHRELVRAVLRDASLQPFRLERIGESGMRRRLRLLPPRPSNARLLHALGFAPPRPG